MKQAENRRFGLGRSNLIDVNIREVQAATAARQLVDAQAGYFRSLADYQARVAQSLPRAALEEPPLPDPTALRRETDAQATFASTHHPLTP